MKLPDSSYVFGRVILVEPPREQAPTPLANLIYIYQDRSTSGDPDRSRLTPMNLLVPPMSTTFEFEAKATGEIEATVFWF